MSTVGVPQWMRRREQTGISNYGEYLARPSPPYIPDESRKVVSFEDVERVMEPILRRHGARWGVDSWDDALYYKDRRSIHNRVYRSALFGIFWPRKKTVGMPLNAEFCPSGRVPLDLPLIVEFQSIHHEFITLFDDDIPHTNHIIGSFDNRFCDPSTPELIPLRRKVRTSDSPEGPHSQARTQSRMREIVVNFRLEYPIYEGILAGYTCPITPPQAYVDEVSLQGMYDLYLYNMDFERDRADLEEIRRNIQYIYDMYTSSVIPMKILQLESLMTLRYDIEGDVRPGTRVGLEQLEEVFDFIKREDADLRARNLPRYAGEKEKRG